MSRSIHTTNRDIEELRRADYADQQRRAEKLDELAEQLAIKRRMKKRVARDRAKIDQGLITKPEMVRIRVFDESEYIHYPASPDDILHVLQALPSGTIDGLNEIELRLGTEKQYAKKEPLFTDTDKVDPYTGRISTDVLPSIYSGWCLGTYRFNSEHISLYAYVYNAAIPDKEMWELYLRLHMLSTLIHEVAHHYDFMMRMARGRWRMDDKDKVEIYAEKVQHEWVRSYVVPYLKEAYPEQVRALDEWIKYHGGVSIPLDVLAGDHRSTMMEKGLLSGIRSFWTVPGAVNSLAKDVNNGKDLQENRLDFAYDLHCAEYYSESLAIIDRILSEHPDDHRALTLRADIFEHQERYDEARFILETVVEKNADDESVWFLLTLVYNAQEDWKALAQAATKVLDNLELNSVRAADYLLDLALANIKLGNTDAAQDDLDEIYSIQWPAGSVPKWIERNVNELKLLLNEVSTLTC